MKKLVLVFMMLLTTVTFAQEEKVVEKSLEQTIKPYVEDLLEAVESGVKWGAQEIPIVIQQYLMFEAVYYGLIVLLGFLFLTRLRVVLCKLVLKKSTEKPDTSNLKSYIDFKEIIPGYWLRYDSDKDDQFTIEQVAYPFLKFGSFIAGGIIVITNITTFIKVAFFPKLYLVEKFIALI